VEPAEGLERIKGKFRRDFEAVIKRVDDLKKAKALDELQTLHQEGIEVMKPGELTGALKGNAIMQQFKTMIKGASSDIAMIMTAKNLEEIYHRYGNMLKEAAASGVDIKIAVPDPHPELVEKFAKFAELRKLDAGPVGRVAIVDGKEMLLGLTDEKTHPTQDVAVWSCSDHAAGELMQPMFELLWEKLEPA
jgi:sugar-specific transcriptional regulator TrmB